MDSVGAVYLDLKLNTSGFNQQMNSLTKTAGGASGAGGLAASFSGLGKIIGAAFAVKTVYNFAKACIELGSDLNEVQNVVNVTFGDGASVINDFAKSSMTAFGLSELAAKQYTGTMGAMLKSMGLAPGAAQEMSMRLAGLAGDMASFYNLSTDEAFGKIRSGMSGETEPLKQLGINLSVANLEAFALSKGIRTAYNEMDQGNQALLRYEYLLKTTSDAQGDFARTSGSWANQTRLLSLQWDSFKASMGQGFINMLTPVLQWINTLMPKLIQLGEIFKYVTASIFGDAGDSLASIAVSTSDAGEGMDGLAGGIGKAGKAARSSLAPFDKLNILTKSIGASGGSGGSIAKVTTETKKATAGTNTLAKGFEEVAKAVEPIVNFVGRLVKGIGDFVKIVWESGLKKFWEDIGITFGNILYVAGKIGDKLGEFSKWAGGSGNIFKDLAWLIGQGFWLAGEGIKEVSIWLKMISDGDWAGLGNRIATGFSNAIIAIDKKLWEWVGALPDWAKDLLGITSTTHTGSSGTMHGGAGGWFGESGAGRGFDGGSTYIKAPGGYGGGTGTVRPISRIPQMAEGGIVTRPTLALIGEKPGSSEAVIPLDKLGQYAGGMGGSDVSAKLDKILAAINNSNGSVQVYLDGVLERQVEYARRKNTRAGRVVIPVGGST